MRISHEHKFLSISIPKTGTKTVRTTFDQINNITKSISDPNSPYYQHVHARRLKEEFDEKGWDWDDYFKFTFVRNPWARMVSIFFYREKMAHQWKHGEGKFKDMASNPSNQRSIQNHQGKRCVRFVKKYPTFKDAIFKGPRRLHQFGETQFNYICDEDGKQLLDFVGKLENLQEDFNTICDKVGIPQQQLPHLNKSKHKHYTEYYDDETRQIVAEKYAKDIEYFGYKFGE